MSSQQVSGALADRRVLIVGASAGIGAATATAALKQGAHVTVSARRKEMLDELIAGHERGYAVTGDATVPAEAEAVAAAANEVMGGIDLMLYVAGFGVIQRLEETDPDTWSSVYRVNVIGANLAATAALKHMNRDGVCAFVSSRTTEDVNGYFTSYSASKQALDQTIRAWRVERPDRRFVRIVMGNCQPTEFANQMGDFELLGEALNKWETQAIPGGMMHVDDVAEALCKALAVSLDHPEIDASELKFDARTA